MKRKFNIFIVLISTVLLTSACSKEEVKEEKKVEVVSEDMRVKETVTEFLDATKEFDIETMRDNVDPEKRDAVNEVYRIYSEDREESRDLVKYLRENASSLSYKINKVEVEKDSAVVNADVRYIDGTPLFKAVAKDYMKDMVTRRLTNKSISKEESVRLMTNSLREKKDTVKQPMDEENIDIRCVKIDDKWYIEELNKELIDVVTSNLYSSIETLEETFNLNLRDMLGN